VFRRVGATARGGDKQALLQCAEIESAVGRVVLAHAATALRVNRPP